MSRREAVALLPLLSAQEYVQEAELYTNQSIDLDLDSFRATGFDLGRGHIGRYYSYAFKCQPRLWEAWIKVTPSDRFKDYILVNRTTRYRNPAISYRFLSGRKDVVFVGYAQEYADFVKECPRVPQVIAEDALQLASWLAGCKLFIGNQSCCYSLCEAMKTRRVLELFPPVPNAYTMGENGWDAIKQDLFQGIVESLL
jgi:hypothetical protein